MNKSYLTAARRIPFEFDEYVRLRVHGQKWCYAHRGFLPRVCFSKDRSRPDGKRTQCKLCERTRWWRSEGRAGEQENV